MLRKSYNRLSDLPITIDEKGRRCRNFNVCHNYVPPGRKYYCSEECRLQVNVLNNFKLLKKLVYKRDNYTCKICGRKFSPSQLECDHIKPIALGGKEFDITNLQTLCKDCHRIKTKQDMEKIRKINSILRR
jgi:hypothetical protein